MNAPTNPKPLQLLLVGGHGRMGSAIRQIAQEKHFLFGFLEAAQGQHPGPGEGPRVIVDFSSPDGATAALRAAVDAKLPFVSGTTGLDEAWFASLDDAANHIPVLHAANMSLGIALMRKLAAMAAQMLPDSFDCELVELHHRRKKDAPSGTGLLLAEAVAEARSGGKGTGENSAGANSRAGGANGSAEGSKAHGHEAGERDEGAVVRDEVADARGEGSDVRTSKPASEAHVARIEPTIIPTRSGVDAARKPGEIGVFGVRGGDVIGDHTLHFLGDGERIELTHRASNRSLFAAGAVRAAEWIAHQPPGRYTIDDVLERPAATAR